MALMAPRVSRATLSAAALPSRGLPPLLLIACTLALLLSAAALSVPRSAGLGRTSRAGGAPAGIAPADVATVLAYAGGVRHDDQLIAVSPGVFARRSNVSGVRLPDGALYFYDFDHGRTGSFGPLATGTIDPSDVEVVARRTLAAGPLVVYRLKPPAAGASARQR